MCQLLRHGNPSAKVRAATTLGELALRAGAALDVAKAGAISAFVSWLVNPNLGQPEIAAAALSDIALDNPDTQAQIAEEGAIEPLVAMIAQGTRANALFTSNALFTRPIAGAVVGACTAHPDSLPVLIPAPALSSEPPGPGPPCKPPLLPPLALTTSVVASASGGVASYSGGVASASGVVASASGGVASASGVVASAAGVGAEEVGVEVLAGASPIEAGAVTGVVEGAVAGIVEGAVVGAMAGAETGAVVGEDLTTPRLATAQASSMRSPQRSPRADQPPRSPRRSPRPPRSPRQPRSAQLTSSTRLARAHLDGSALALPAPTPTPPQAVYTVLSTPPTSTQVAAALKLSIPHGRPPACKCSPRRHVFPTGGGRSQAVQRGRGGAGYSGQGPSGEPDHDLGGRRSRAADRAAGPRREQGVTLIASECLCLPLPPSACL